MDNKASNSEATNYLMICGFNNITHKHEIKQNIHTFKKEYFYNYSNTY